MKGYIKDRTYYKYEKESGKLRMCEGSWSINLDQLDLNIVEKIVYITSYAKYEVELADAMMKGFMRKFKGENKLIVPMKNWTITFKHEMKGETDGR